MRYLGQVFCLIENIRFLESTITILILPSYKEQQCHNKVLERQSKIEEYTQKWFVVSLIFVLVKVRV